MTLLILLSQVFIFAATVDEVVEPTVNRSVKSALIVDIPVPITWNSVQSVHRTLQQACEELRTGEKTGPKKPKGTNDPNPAQMPTLILNFKVPPNQEAFAQTSKFEACYALANFLLSDEMQGIRTVAYLPQTVEGHAVLVALACNEIVIADNAEFGAAGINEKQVTSTQRQAYREIARRFPEKIVEKILDKGVELWAAETDTGTAWTDAAGLAELRKNGKLIKEPTLPLIPAGQLGIIPAQQARLEMGIVDAIAAEQEGEIGLANAIGCKPEQIKRAKVYAGSTRAVKIELYDQVTDAKVNEIQGLIEKAIAPGKSPLTQLAERSDESEKNAAQSPADFICLVIDSPGGSLTASLNLAAFLANDVDPMKVRTVAYIPNRALSDSALIALACDE
ncbi:MAG: hypothetical protein ACRC2T_06725, partial [Thermoguttaceae bacterium]